MDDLESARNIAYRFLGYSARSRAEVEKRLERSEFTPEIIQAVIDEFELKGYLNDEKFAKDWIADRADRKNYGRNRLAAELNRKGVSRETIKETLDANDDEESEFRRALESAKSKWKLNSDLETTTDEINSEKRRVSGFLQRRGFSFQIIKKVLAELMSNKH